MSTTPVVPTLDENLFLPDAIEFNITNNPALPFYTFADSSVLNGTKTITHLEFGRAAHRVAHILRPNRNGAEGEVVALLLQADTVLYHAIVAGLIVAGCVPFAISPRNSPGAIIELLLKTSCRRLLTTHGYLEPLIESIKSHIIDTSIARELQIEDMPSIASVYPYFTNEVFEHPFEFYPSAPHRPSKDDLCLYLHSSGSTGNPRPIGLTHIFWIHWQGAISDKSKSRLTIGCMCMPPFHAFGIGIQLFVPIYVLFSIAVYPPNAASPDKPSPPVVPSPENVLEHMKLTKSDVLVAPPTFYQIWALLPEAVKYLKTLKYAAYGGGPLATKMGNLLVEAGVTLHATYGGTEFGMNTRLLPPADKDPKDWEYMQFNDHMNTRWAPQGDGTFELQLLSHEGHQTMIDNLPDVSGYATSDLWRPHPTTKGLWKMQTIEDANSIAPAHSRIFKEMILFTSQGKPLPFTPKGTLARKAAIKLYEEEINALYENVGAVAGQFFSPASWSATDIHAWLLEQASDVMSGATVVNPDDDLFEQGFDSLYATSLRLRIVNALRCSKDPEHQKVAKSLSLNLVYSFPVIKDLAAFISSLLTSEDVQGDAASRSAAAMEAMITKYSSGLDVPLPSPLASAPLPAIILLTGSTGNLGSQILARLLEDSRVEKVYAYNRAGSKPILQRHIEKFENVGLDVALLKIPEDVMEDVSVALGGGYGEAKHILLRSGLQSLSFRVGQIIGGRPRGVWPTTEWLPILVKSSVSLGNIPDTSGIASWLGADTISATIVDLALNEHSTLPRALNLVHPRPVQQSVIIKSIRGAIAKILGHDLKLVPFSQWFAILEEHAENATAGTWANIPAIKLLEFFRSYANADVIESTAHHEAGGLPSLSTEKVQRISRFMSPEKLPQIGDDDAKLWVSYWHSVGFLN
ncbi:putative NRPS-like protein biosynthetic cluster [Termitomyces sp. T159_Od127]|nr:putative NRPS-like protein biosynthetic cluster [Termitomyces sp. T159_Od127]